MRILIAIFISVTPFNKVRIFLYRLLLKYDISYKATINCFNLIVCKNLSIKENSGFKGHFNIVKNVENFMIERNVWIKKLNRFQNCNYIKLFSEVFIGTSNTFYGTSDNISPFKSHENIYIGEKSIITSRHIFDLSDTIEIGKDVIFGGSGSQIWTHGFDLLHIKKQSPITIGDNCYIGSRVILLPGINICTKVSIGSGSVVSKNIQESGFYVSSSLVKKGEVSSFKDDPDIVNKNNYYFVRK